jgi:hypothetical protein
MGKQRLVWISGAAVILALLVIGGGLYLKRHYCWDCTASERFAFGVELLCDRDEDARARGVSFISRAAAQGHLEAQALAAELFLQPLPKRYARMHPDLFECAAADLTPDNSRAVGYFEALARSGQISPRVEYNLGVLIDEGILEPPFPNRGGADYFRSAAHRGEPHAMYEVGKIEDRQKRFAEAAGWFKESFSRGAHPGAALMLGDYTFYGRLGAVDPETAIPWYQKALVAAESPEFAGAGADFAQRARQRLKIADEFRQRTGGSAAISVSYQLAGGLDEYRVYAAESQALIGRVLRVDGSSVVATFLGGREGETAGKEREAVSMNDGLNWILETYAVGRYGGDQKFRFELVAN